MMDDVFRQHVDMSNLNRELISAVTLPSTPNHQASLSLARQLFDLFHSSALSWSFAAAMFSRDAQATMCRDRQHHRRFLHKPRERKLHHADLRRFASASKAWPACSTTIPLPPIGAHG